MRTLLICKNVPESYYVLLHILVTFYKLTFSNDFLFVIHVKSYQSKGVLQAWLTRTEMFIQCSASLEKLLAPFAIHIDVKTSSSVVIIRSRVKILFWYFFFHTYIVCEINNVDVPKNFVGCLSVVFVQLGRSSIVFSKYFTFTLKSTNFRCLYGGVFQK